MTHSSSLSHTDISGKGWVARLPVSIQPYARLMRLDRPIGIWLLLLPGWWSILLASGGIAGMTPEGWKLMALFALGAIIMRGAGCTINDLWDRNFDGRVERTKPRPIPAGEITIPRAFIFLFFQLCLGFLILIQFNEFACLVGFASIFLIVAYPLMKRITFWPQAFLGLTFNWGALLGWAAVMGELSLAPIILYISGIFWTLGYDTIYAHQDKQDDALLGLKSTALKFGAHSKKWLTGFYVLTSVGWIAAGILLTASPLYYVFLLPAILHLFWQLYGWNIEDPADCLMRFKSNRVPGWILILASASL